MSTKRIVIGLGVVIAIALGIASFTGVIPPKNGVMGTIGAAKRYQTTQISAGDVTLTDADMQDLLQSDLFHQLVTDANFREVMRTQSESFRTVLMDKQFRDLLGKQGFAEVMRSEVFRTAVAQNRYDLLAKASPADYQRTQLTERTQSTLDRGNVEQLKTQVTSARTEVAKAQAAYDKSVADLLKTSTVAGKQEMVAKIESAKAQNVAARTEVAKAQAAYDKTVTELSKMEQAKTEVAKAEMAKADIGKAGWNKTDLAKVEQAKAELAKAQDALDKTTTLYQKSVTELSKLSDVAARQDVVSKVEQSKASTDAARTQLAKANTAYERTVNTALDRAASAEAGRASQAEAGRTADTNAYAQAQELARSEQFKTVFADANFREVAKSNEFAKLVTMDKFQQIAKMDNFQKAASNPDVWKQVTVERTESVQ
jgi:hypothetical protein